MPSVAKGIMGMLLWTGYMQNTALLDRPDPNLPLPKQTLCMHAYQGSTHPHPVSELKRGLVSQARILEFVGSQQTLPSSEGLRTKKKRQRERGRGKKEREKNRERQREKKTERREERKRKETGKKKRKRET